MGVLFEALGETVMDLVNSDCPEFKTSVTVLSVSLIFGFVEQQGIGSMEVY